MGEKDNGSDAEWRELAVETVRNLSSLLEEAEALLRRAQKIVRELEERAED